MICKRKSLWKTGGIFYIFRLLFSVDCCIIHFDISPDVAQFGRALALGARCRRFESCRPDQKEEHLKGDALLFASIENSPIVTFLS